MQLPGKESACNVGDLGSIPRLGRSPGERNSYSPQYSGLENSINKCRERRIKRYNICELEKTRENCFNRYPKETGSFHFWSLRNGSAVSNLSKYSRIGMRDSLRMPWEMLMDLCFYRTNWIK